METELRIKFKVRDGIKANLSGELKDGDFQVHSVDYLALKWEAPYWVHEMKVKLSTRLPGDYDFPTQTIYLEKGLITQSIKSPQKTLKVNSLMKTKTMIKDSLKEVELKDEKNKSLQYELIPLIGLFIFALWRLCLIKEPKEILLKVLKKELPSFDAFISMIDSKGYLDISEKEELNRKLHLSLSKTQQRDVWILIIEQWENLRFSQSADKNELSQLCRQCRELDKDK